MRTFKILPAWTKIIVCVVGFFLVGSACSASSNAGEESFVSGEVTSSIGGDTATSSWASFWPDFSSAVAKQDSLTTADLTNFPYPGPWGEPIGGAVFVEEYDSLFPEEVRGAFAQPGRQFSIEVEGFDVVITSELQRIGEGGKYPGIVVDNSTARVFVVSETSAAGTETSFHYVFDLVDSEYRFTADFVF